MPLPFTIGSGRTLMWRHPKPAPGGTLGTPTFVAQAVANATATTLACNVPAGVQDGDLLVAVYANANAALTLTPPAGWNLIETALPSTSRLAMFYRVASSEPASYTWSLTGSTVIDIGIFAYRQTGGTPLDGAGTTNTGTGTSAVGPGITTTNNNSLLVLAALSAGTRTYSATSLDTERIDVGGAGHNSLGVFDGLQATAGASGNKSATISSSATWGAVMAAFKPSGSA